MELCDPPTPALGGLLLLPAELCLLATRCSAAFRRQGSCFTPGAGVRRALFEGCASVLLVEGDLE